MVVRITPREDQRAENEQIARKILDDPRAYFEEERARVREEVEREMRGVD